MKQANSQKRMMAAVVIIILIVAAVVAVLYAQRDTTTTPPSQTAPSEQTSDTSGADTDADTDTDADADADTDATGISKTEAENIATDKYGGTVKETESDDYQGTPAWEVEIRDSDKGRIEVKVDKQSGEILNTEQD